MQLKKHSANKIITPVTKIRDDHQGLFGEIKAVQENVMELVALDSSSVFLC